MIEALKSDEIVNKVGGRFKLTALIQRRLAQLIEGDRPLVERKGRTDFEVVIDEILQDKITFEYDAAAPMPRKADSAAARRAKSVK
ncbi:MAG: hypothetical protein U0575_12700 [Phycisphaerales bacterium]